MEHGAIELRCGRSPGPQRSCDTAPQAAAACVPPPLPPASCSSTRQEAPSTLLPCRGAGGDIAERNEEINRRRLGREGGAGGRGPLRVTDPAALARLMAEMKAKADQQR